MSWRKIVCALMVLTTLAVSCQREQPAKEKSAQASPDEAEIRSHAQAYSDAFNRGDPEKIASLWAQNAVYVNPSTGETYDGRNEIAQFFKDRFAQNDGAHLEITVDSIEFNGNDTAIEKGHFSVSYKNRPAISGAFANDFIKENGKWLLQKVREVDFKNVSSHYDHLKDLDWLVGDWIDQDENVDIAYNWKWDKNKNYLTEHFIVKMLNYDQIEGYQIVGWDPVKEQIRSWIFDTDGGYGESYWTLQGNSWYATTIFTLPDGRKGTTTHVYTKVDDNTYTFASIGRDIAGKVMPDMGPFKVIRKK